MRVSFKRILCGFWNFLVQYASCLNASVVRYILSNSMKENIRGNSGIERWKRDINNDLYSVTWFQTQDPFDETDAALTWFLQKGGKSVQYIKLQHFASGKMDIVFEECAWRPTVYWNRLLFSVCILIHWIRKETLIIASIVFCLRKGYVFVQHSCFHIHTVHLDNYQSPFTNWCTIK